MIDQPKTLNIDPTVARAARNYFLGFLGLVVCYRIGVLLTLDVPLFYDEAYYFGWAEDLAFGYFSKPRSGLEHRPNHRFFRVKLGCAIG